MMDREDLIAQLQQIYPDRILGKASIQKITRTGLYTLVRQFSGEEHMGSEEWLVQQGFIFLEDDMRVFTRPSLVEPNDRIASLPIEAAVPLWIDQCPIIGNHIGCSQENQKVLYEYAKNYLLGGWCDSPTTARDALTWMTVILLRNWNSEETEQSFWGYIFEQFGFKNALDQRLYYQFREAIDNSLLRHNRYIASSEDTKKYYTTLLAHALAPKKSVFALFELVLQFYRNNLEYRYFPQDEGYAAFSRYLSKQLSGSQADSLGELQLTNISALQVGFKDLFRNRPHYMRDFVENIVRQLDHLITGTFVKETYCDHLLQEWYEEKGAYVHINFRKIREDYSGKERVATKFSRIDPWFALEKQDNRYSVFLWLPAIRYGEMEGTNFIANIYNDNTLLHSQQLHLYGDSFCISSHSEKIKLPDDSFAGTGLLIRVEIRCDDVVLYDSKEKLYRKYILFHQQGAEYKTSVLAPGWFYFLCAKRDGVQFYGENSRQIPHPGNLFRFTYNEDDVILFNGDLITAAVAAQDLRGVPTRPFLPHITYQEAGKEYRVFTKQFDLQVLALSLDAAKGYVVHIADENMPLSHFSYQSGKEQVVFRIPIACQSNVPTVLLITELDSGRCVYSLHYMLLVDFTYTLDRPYYMDYEETVTVHLNTPLLPSLSTTCTGQRMPGDAAVAIPLGKGTLEIAVPLLMCALGEERILSPIPRRIWWEDTIGKMLELEIPEKYSASLLIAGKHQGIEVVNGHAQYDIGNHLQLVDKAEKATQRVELSLTGDEGGSEQVVLLEVLFQDQFVGPPLHLREKLLYWSAEDTYIGKSQAGFIVELSLPTQKQRTYAVTEKDQLLEKELLLQDGIYPYTVSAAGKSIFAPKTTEFYAGTLIVGDYNVFRFHHKEVRLTKAVYEKSSDELKYDSAVITQISYQGISEVNGENFPYPCYEGQMYYIKYNGERRWFSAEQKVRHDITYERVNPVSFWLINDMILALRNPDGEGIYVNKQQQILTDREPVKYNETYYDNPDYFEYDIKG